MPVPAALPYVAAGLDFLGGRQEDQADQMARIQDMIERRKALQAHWNSQLMDLGQRNSEQGDERLRSAVPIAGAQAMAPLLDRGFSAITSRFAQGPGVFGQVGQQNRSMQAANANYQPGQNPSINQYGADLESIKRRFMERPIFDNDEWRRGVVRGGPSGGMR